MLQPSASPLSTNSTAVFGFAILGFAPGFWLSVLAFAGVGFGLAVTFPCLFALAGKLAPANRAAAMSYVAAVGGAPRVILPWVMGWLASQYSLGAVFAACAFHPFLNHIAEGT